MNQNLWAEFCDRLKTAGELINNSQAPDDALIQAEGYRYLTRLIRAGLESCVEGADPLHPMFYSLSHDSIKIGNDNPDNYYLNASINGKYDYLVEGEFAEIDYFSLATKVGNYATTGQMRPSGELTSDAIKIADNKNFKVIVSATQPADKSQNWLPMTPDSDSLIIRQYCNARRERPVQFTIRCLNSQPSMPLNPEVFPSNCFAPSALSKAPANCLTSG